MAMVQMKLGHLEQVGVVDSNNQSCPWCCGCGLTYCTCLYNAQAVHHFRQSADLTKVAEEKGNSLHLLGGALKDLNRLDEAEQVRTRR